MDTHHLFHFERYGPYTPQVKLWVEDGKLLFSMPVIFRVTLMTLCKKLLAVVCAGIVIQVLSHCTMQMALYCVVMQPVYCSS